MNNAIINTQALTINNAANFKNSALAEATSKIVKIYNDALTYAEDKNRQIASILSTVKNSKCYETDGFKSVAEYAETVFGMKQANAYALAAAGDIYNDEKASTELKAISPSKLAEVSKVERKSLEEAIKGGTLTSATTQKGFRDFAKAQKASEKDEKEPELFTALMAEPIADKLADVLGTPRTIKEWETTMKDIAKERVKNLVPESSDVELLKLSKGHCPHTTSDSGNYLRYLAVVDGAYPFLFVLLKAKKPTKKAKPEAVNYFTPEQMAALLSKNPGDLSGDEKAAVERILSAVVGQHDNAKSKK